MTGNNVATLGMRLGSISRRINGDGHRRRLATSTISATLVKRSAVCVVRGATCRPYLHHLSRHNRHVTSAVSCSPLLCSTPPGGAYVYSSYDSTNEPCNGPARRNTSSSSEPKPGPWHEKYLLLEEYKKKHGNCLVPRSFDVGFVRLGVWVNRQRVLYKKGKLSADRREMMNALGFSWDPLADQRERNFALLEQFKEREGHGNVPNDRVEDGTKLGIWIKIQRETNKKDKLGESDQQRLEKLGVSWDPLGDQWERSFALLEQYKEREGHCSVSRTYEQDGVKLGEWVNKQRQQYKKGKLDELYQQRLEAVSISWDPNVDQWERNFSILVQYKEREGHCSVPFRHEEDGAKLGAWLSK